MALMGFRQGVIKENPYFTLVDSLEIYDTFIADEAGILKINTDSNCMHPKREEANSNCFDAKWLNTLKADTLNEFNKVLLNYVYQQPINSSGFRSITFDTSVTTSATKILLIGDSFTYGHSARPIQYSFADKLLQKGFAVYNTGISGADPAQYEAVAKKYISLLQPDIVIVNYYTGNDAMHYYRELKAQQPNYYLTNAGNIWAYPQGFYLMPKQSYAYTQSMLFIPNQETNIFNLYMAQTRVTTFLWSLLAKFHIVNPYQQSIKAIFKENYIPWSPTSVADYYINNIDSICIQHNTPFLVSVIPDYFELEDAENIIKRKHFPNNEFVLCPNLTASDYRLEPSDLHFNNEGHAKYADFLEKEIKQLLTSKPQP